MAIIMGRGIAVTGKAVTPREKFNERMLVRYVRGFDDLEVEATSDRTIDLCIETDFDGVMRSISDPKKFRRFVDGVIATRDARDKAKLDNLGERIARIKQKHALSLSIA